MYVTTIYRYSERKGKELETGKMDFTGFDMFLLPRMSYAKKVKPFKF